MITILSRSTVIAAALCLGTWATAGCGRASEVRRLQSENAALRQELDELKHGPARLLAQAESKLNAGAPANAQAALDTLLERHPQSPEAGRAKTLAARVDAAIAKQEQEARQREEQAAGERKRQETAEARRLAQATSKMRTKVDQIEKVTWYKDRTTPRFANYNSFHIYFGKHENGSLWLRLRIQYNAEDWLFIHSFLVVAEDQRFDYPQVEFERDNSSEIWEWYDEPATAGDIAMVKAVIGSRKAVIRFTGHQYRKDRTITQAEKQALQNVLDAYVALGGSPP